MRRTGRKVLPISGIKNQEIVFRPLPLQSVHIGDDLGYPRQKELPNSTARIAELQDDIEGTFSTIPDAVQIVDELTKGPEPIFGIIHASEFDTFPAQFGIRMQRTVVNDHFVSTCYPPFAELSSTFFKSSVVIGDAAAAYDCNSHGV